MNHNGHEITERQAQVLKLFNRKKPPTVGEAAKVLGCSSSNVCQILRTLETRGVFIRDSRQITTISG